VRISASGGSNLKSAAFLNTDGSVAVVIINSGTGTQNVGISLAGGAGLSTKVKAWYTDNTHDMSETAVTFGNDGTASASVTGRGMISFLVTAGNATVV